MIKSSLRHPAVLAFQYRAGTRERRSLAGEKMKRFGVKGYEWPECKEMYISINLFIGVKLPRALVFCVPLNERNAWPPLLRPAVTPEEENKAALALSLFSSRKRVTV